MSSPAFWLVWCPTGAGSPRHRHESLQDAQAEASRLARTAPGAEFYVLQALERRTVNAVQIEALEVPLGADIPF